MWLKSGQQNGSELFGRGNFEFVTMSRTQRTQKNNKKEIAFWVINSWGSTSEAEAVLSKNLVTFGALTISCSLMASWLRGLDQTKQQYVLSPNETRNWCLFRDIQRFLVKFPDI